MNWLSNVFGPKPISYTPNPAEVSKEWTNIKNQKISPEEKTKKLANELHDLAEKKITADALSCIASLSDEEALAIHNKLTPEQKQKISQLFKNIKIEGPHQKLVESHLRLLQTEQKIETLVQEEILDLDEYMAQQKKLEQEREKWVVIPKNIDEEVEEVTAEEPAKTPEIPSEKNEKVEDLEEATKKLEEEEKKLDDEWEKL